MIIFICNRCRQESKEHGVEREQDGGLCDACMDERHRIKEILRVWWATYSDAVMVSFANRTPLPQPPDRIDFETALKDRGPEAMGLRYETGRVVS